MRISHRLSALVASVLLLASAQAATPLKLSPVMPMTAAKARAFKLSSPD